MKNKKNESTPIGPDELALLETMLKKQYVELAKGLRSLGEEIKNGYSGNGRDLLSDKEEVDTLESEDRLEEKELYLIEEALQRMAEGTYGRCLDCGCHINIERLKVLPYAEFCMKCEEQREKKG